MTETYFSSDQHHFHKKIQEFCPSTRPACSLEEMTERIIEAHNSVVKPGDNYWHLGDFSFGSEDQTLNVIRRMNGNKHFIRGNHDYTLDKSNKCKALLSFYGDYKKLKIDDHKVILMHFPIQSWDSMHHGAIHLHGHLHSPYRLDSSQKSSHHCGLMKNRMDVGIDHRPTADLSPWSWEEIKAEIKVMNEQFI